MSKWGPMRTREVSALLLLTTSLAGGLFLSKLSCCQTPPRRRGVAVIRPTPEAAAKSATYYALIIGIKNYQNFTPLDTPLNDAKDVAAVLHDQYGFKTQLLLDATRDQILDALGHYRTELHEEDNLLIYYAGHGYFDKPSDLAYWYPVEAGKASTARWINASEITGQARAIAARHVLVIADSCYSGMITSGVRTLDPRLDAPQERVEFLTKLLEQKSRHVLSSGGNEPVSDRDTDGHPTGHSVFANVLLQGLRDFREDQYSAEELFHYVRERVAGRSTQIPEFNPIRDSDHNGGDFIFLRSRALPAPPIKDVIIPASSTVKLVEPHIEPPRHPVNADESVIRAVLQRYEEAYASMDIDLLKAIWPTLSKQKIKDLRAGFQGAQAVKVHVENCEIPTKTTDVARVFCDQLMAYTREGKRQPETKDPVEISLKRVGGGGWVVADVRGRAGD